MQMQPLISQERIQELTRMHLAVEASLLPDPEGKKQVMRVRSQNGEIDAFLAMVNKPEARTFATIESAWRLTRKLGIKNFVIDNEKFAGVAA